MLYRRQIQLKQIFINLKLVFDNGYTIKGGFERGMKFTARIKNIFRPKSKKQQPVSDIDPNTNETEKKKKKRVRKKKTTSRLGNMKLAPKILIAFLIIAMLSTAMGAYATISLTQVSASSNSMYTNVLLPTKNLADIGDILNTQAIKLREALLNDSDAMKNAYVSQLRMNKFSLDSKIKMVESLMLQEDEELAALNDFKEKLAIFMPLFDKAVDNLEAENKQVVIDDVAGYGELKEAQVTLDKSLSSFKYAVSNGATSQNRKNKDTSDSVLLINIIAAGVVILMSVLIGIVLSRGISRPVKKLTQNVKLLAAGQTDFEMDTMVTKDEIGQMREAFRTIVQAIRDLENDTDVLIEAAMEGRLSERADVEKHQGSYRRIVEGINATLDATIQPINESAQVLDELSQGNLNVGVTGEFKGDFAIVKNALNMTVETLKMYINDITYVLSQIAEGILTVSIDSEYKGDFAELKTSINKAVHSFHNVLGDIDGAAEEVASGTTQVSGSSQTISQGATEQASAIEELTASVTQIAQQTKHNAKNADQANQLSLKAKEDAMSGNEKMKELQSAMEEINESSANISKIIKVIDEIAFQTNILALNAAVEAARAGAHGKGFAVVAEEVRNLAARSATAARETTDIIEGSIKKTKAGTRIADETAEALLNIVEGVEKTVNLSGEIASSSGEQAAGIDQVNRGITQLSAVVQNNSATSEEVAASAEVLSGQANNLKKMVGMFRLVDEPEEVEDELE